MKKAPSLRRPDDSDARAIRRASRAVGLQLTITSSVLVLAVLVAAFTFVFSHIKPGLLFTPVESSESTVDVGGLQILIGGVGIGIVAIILAGTMSWFATRRAVRPLGRALRLQRAFVADASHELRTPLTVLDARLQLLQRGLPHGDPSLAIVSQLRHDTETLIGIVNDLLTLAEVDHSSVTSGPVPVTAVVQRAVDSMTILAEQRSVTIRVTEATDALIAIPSSSIERCVVALLDNALDFSPPESSIEVSVEQIKKLVIITVRDHGPGISGIHPSRIFDRFARSHEATGGGGTDRVGFGIGLSLVRETVERFGGVAAVRETSSTGTAIEIRIPSAPVP